MFAFVSVQFGPITAETLSWTNNMNRVIGPVQITSDLSDGPALRQTLAYEPGDLTLVGFITGVKFEVLCYQ